MQNINELKKIANFSEGVIKNVETNTCSKESLCYWISLLRVRLQTKDEVTTDKRNDMFTVSKGDFLRTTSDKFTTV